MLLWKLQLNVEKKMVSSSKAFLATPAAAPKSIAWVPCSRGLIHLHVCSDMSGDTLDTITTRICGTPKYLPVRLKFVWIGSCQYAWIRNKRSSPLSLRQQKADMMKHDFSLLLGNSIIYPRYKTNKRDRRWLWLVLAAAALTVSTGLRRRLR